MEIFGTEEEAEYFIQLSALWVGRMLCFSFIFLLFFLQLLEFTKQHTVVPHLDTVWHA